MNTTTARTLPLDELRAAVGADNVLTSHRDMVTYSTDATPLHAHLPDAVVLASSKQDVSAVLRLAQEHRFPVTPRGSGTNLSAGVVPIHGGVVLSCARMGEILEIDSANLTASVQPGVHTAQLAAAVAARGLFYPPDPGSQSIATIGGNVSECSGGLRGLKYGITRDYVLGIEAVLVGGEVMRVGSKLAKDVAGYDLVRLLVGSEGTLAVITEVTLKLLPMPEAKMTGAAFFADLEASARSVGLIIEDGILPATLEFLDKTTMRVVDESAGLGLPADAGAMLIFGQDGAPSVVERDTQRMAQICREQGAISVDVAASDAEAEKLLTARRGAIPALARLAPTLILEDATVPRSELPSMVREIERIAADEKLLIAVFGHAGDGNIHPVCCIDERDPEQVAAVHRAFDRIFDAALARGGTITGEHGVGMTKLAYLEKKVGMPAIEVMRGIKRAFDPLGLLNPGKAVP